MSSPLFTLRENPKSQTLIFQLSPTFFFQFKRKKEERRGEKRKRKNKIK
jgi:hypothetical protein